ncbi:MAG TPA: hypothetical protein VH590_16680 [Ktedonobacterales bacterium]
MHAFAVVLVPAGTEDVLQAVTHILSFSDSNKEVEPHKVYLSNDLLRIWSEMYGIPITDLSDLAERMNEESKTIYEIDKGGIFCITTSNYQGQWDYWVIGGRWDGVIQGKSRNTKGRSNYGPEHEQWQYNICPVSGLHADVLPVVVVTPDGRWHEMECQSLDPTDEEAERWRAILRPLLEQYHDCIAVGVDTHL